jgi:hypothetical protein
MKIGDKAVYWPDHEGIRKEGIYYVRNEGIIIGQGQFESGFPYWIVRWDDVPSDITDFWNDTTHFKRIKDGVIVSITKEWIKSPEEAAALLL